MTNNVPSSFLSPSICLLLRRVCCLHFYPMVFIIDFSEFFKLPRCKSFGRYLYCEYILPGVVSLFIFLSNVFWWRDVNFRPNLLFFVVRHLVTCSKVFAYSHMVKVFSWFRFNISTRASQSWHHWHFGLGNLWRGGVALCLRGWLAALLASGQWTPAAVVVAVVVVVTAEAIFLHVGI